MAFLDLSLCCSHRIPFRKAMTMIYLVIFLFGLAFGSFLNVCIARVPAGISIVKPRSRCPKCGRLIRWHDNIPLASYLILRGRCRDCNTRISPVYPLVEALTASLFVADFAEYGPSSQFVKWAVFSSFIVILAVTDLRERRLPHPITITGFALGVLLSLWVPVPSQPIEWFFARMGYSPGERILSAGGSLSGALLGAGMFYAVGEVFYLLRHKEGLGFGDVMLMLMIGAFVGPALTVMTILFGSLLGTLVAVPLYFANDRFRQYEWPFGSFLSAAAIFTSLGGAQLLRAYLLWAGVR